MKKSYHWGRNYRIIKTTLQRTHRTSLSFSLSSLQAQHIKTVLSHREHYCSFGKDWQTTSLSRVEVEWGTLVLSVRGMMSQRLNNSVTPREESRRDGDGDGCWRGGVRGKGALTPKSAGEKKWRKKSLAGRVGGG